MRRAGRQLAHDGKLVGMQDPLEAILLLLGNQGVFDRRGGLGSQPRQDVDLLAPVRLGARRSRHEQHPRQPVERDKRNHEGYAVPLEFIPL